MLRNAPLEIMRPYIEKYSREKVFGFSSPNPKTCLSLFLVATPEKGVEHHHRHRSSPTRCRLLILVPTFRRANRTRAISESTQSVPFVQRLRRDTTVGTSHKAQTIGTTRHLYALRPLVHSASYRPGRATLNLDVNFNKPFARS